MAKCPHCEQPVVLEKGQNQSVRRQTVGSFKKEVMYSCPHCEKVLGFAYYLGGLWTGRP